MAIAMLRNVGLLEKKAGNAADKQRAFQAAQSALAFGEWWLSQGHSTQAPVACSTLLTTNASQGAAAPVQICKDPLPLPVTPLTAGMTYTPPNLTVATGGGLDASGNTNYALSPQLYIRSVGYAADGRALFEVTGVGYGGAPTTMAVVQSTFGVTTGTTSLGRL
jgi:type IV pilus assembly protein PilX